MTTETTLVEASIFPRLIVRSGGKVVEEVELQAEFSIGRAEDNDLQLPDPKASRHHARLQQEGAVFVVTDLGSANGTRINGIQIADPQPLEHGDRINIGDMELTYQEPGRAAQDTLTMQTVAGPPAAGAAGAPWAVPPPPEPSAQPSQGMGRGVIIGLVLVAAVAILAIVATVFFLPRLLNPTTPTATVSSASPTPSSQVETPAATAAPTVVTATPVAGGGLDAQETNELLDQAEALNKRSKFEESVAIYENLTERDPEDARPEIGWAWALVLDDEASEALSHAERATELDPTSAEAAAVLGRVHADLGDKTQSLAWAEKAVDLDPGSAQAQAVLAQAYMLNGQSQEAIDAADLALVQDINNADAHRARGWLYHVLDNDMGRAASELQIAAGLQPELWLRRHELGTLLFEAEDYVTAIMAFQDALGIRPKAVTYSAIGEAYYQLGQYDQARASLQQAVSAGAEDAHTYGVLAATLAQLNRCDEAETYYEQALESEPSHPLAKEAKEICEGEGPSPTPSPTTGSTSEPAAESTSEATAEPTKPPSRPAALSGQIAFPVWGSSGAKYDTYIANADGSGRHLVAEEMHQPAIRPDGLWLAVNGERANFRNLSLVEPDGSELREITNFEEDGQPAWSPNGEKLAIGSYRHGDKQWRIYIIDDVPFGGGKVEGRTLNNGADDIRGQMPAWTADGQIVYRGCNLESPRNECEGIGLYVMSAAPGPQPATKLTEHPGDTAPAVFGNKILFMSNRDGNSEVYVMNLDGSGVKRLTNNAANDGLPVWSPDGRTIAYVSDQGGPWAIWAMSPNGSNQRKLFPIGGEGLSFDWPHERISWGQ